MTIIADEFDAVKFEAVLSETDQIDCRRLADHFREAMKGQEENSLPWRVYRLMFDLCLIHLKPSDAGEPFGPIFQGPDGRSAIPSDFSGSQSEELARLAPTIQNPALRARLADVAWHNHRRLADAGRLAVTSYGECIEWLIEGRGALRNENPHPWEPTAIDMLRRAMMVATALGKGKSEHQHVIELAVKVRELALEGKNARGYWKIADLDLDYGLPLPAKSALRPRR